MTDSKVFDSFYQGGLRSYSIEDPTRPEDSRRLHHAGRPTGRPGPAYEGHRRYTVGSEIGKGLTVLELNHETPGEQTWKTDESLGVSDVLEPTMQEPL